MLTLPAKLRRKKQPYLSIRSQPVRRNLHRQAVLFFSELRDFMAARGVGDSGPGFMRYLSIGKNGELDIEFGYLTTRVHAGGGPVRSGILPAGTFMTAEWTGPYDGVPPWDQVEVGQFPGALQFGIDEMLREIDAIAANPEKPTFENTIVAMEKAGERLGNVQSVLGVYSSNLATPEVQALTKEWSPKLSADIASRMLPRKPKAPRTFIQPTAI